MVEKLFEVPEQWRTTINVARRATKLPIEDLVFVEQGDGTLRYFDGPMSIERKPGHCIIVRGVSRKDDGTFAAQVTYASPSTQTGSEE